ncbi:hypothetical protein OHU25_40145 [Streptomyces sp. NBC_00117]|uniref:hypothetical protein n=1 Tax=Streptomyces TaxID=1883 RepID=UPI0031D0B76C
MTEVELVVTALASGAPAGVTDTARGVVHDLSAALGEMTRGRPAGLGVRGGNGVQVPDAYKTDPDVWRTRLLQVLASGMEMDEELIEPARPVLRADCRAGHITVGMAGS